MDLTAFDAMLKEHFSLESMTDVAYCDSSLLSYQGRDPISALLGPLEIPLDWSLEFFALVQKELDHNYDDMTPAQEAEQATWNLEQAKAWGAELARRKGMVASGAATLEERNWGIDPDWLAHRKRERERCYSQYLAAAERVRLAQESQ